MTVTATVTEVTAKLPRRWLKILLILAVTAAVCAVGLAIYMNTESFQALVRRRLVAEIERITGGRAQVGSIHTIPFRLQAEVRNITVHGRESAADIPLAHADSILARLKLTSLLHSEFAFHELILDQPVVHIVLYPDGSSNIPPRAGAASSQTSVEKIFALSIDHLKVSRGQVLWDDQKVNDRKADDRQTGDQESGDQTLGWEINAHDLSLAMDYSFLHSRYDGRFSLGMVETKLPDCRPFTWSSAADFSLTTDSVIFTSLKWNSGHSDFFVRGNINDFHHPRAQAIYQAHVDLGEAAGIARRHDLQAGVLDLKGDANGSLDQFTSNGSLNLHDLGFQNDRLVFSKASLASDFSVSDRQLKFSKLQAKIFGGSVAGEAVVNQWLVPDRHLSPAERKAQEVAVISAAPPARKGIRASSSSAPKPPASQSATISLRLHDISAEAVATALGTAAHRFPDFHLASQTSGTIEARWKGTRRDAEIQFALEAAPPTQSMPAQAVERQLPLNARANGTYFVALDTLDLPQFTLGTPTSHVQAAGKLSSSSSLRISVTTSSMADWLPVVEAVRGPSLIPVTLNGRATFNGTLTGSLSAPQLAGNLQVENFNFNIPTTAKTAALQTHWDSLATAIQLSFDSVALRNATLTLGDISSEFDGDATLDHGHFTPDSQIAFRANLHHTSLAALQSIAGYNYPIVGTADLVVQGAGSAADPHGEGRVHLNQAVAYGETIQQFDSAFHFAHGEFALDDIHLQHDDSVITGSAAFHPATRGLRLDLAGNNFDLAHIPQLQSDGLPVEGRADFVVNATGTPQAPVIHADVHLRNLSLDHELAGNVDLHATPEGGLLHLTGTSHLHQGSLQLSGDVQLPTDGLSGSARGEATFRDVSVALQDVDLDALWRAYLGQQLTGHSDVSGVVHLRGPVLHPWHWLVEGDLSTLAIEVEDVKLHNQSRIQFTIANQSLDIRQLHLLGEATDLTAKGSIQLVTPFALNLDSDGHLDLKLASSFDSEVTASGLMTMKMTLTGTFADPLPQGTLFFENGSLSYAGVPSGLGGLGGSLVFTRDHIHIQTLTARTGGGTLALQGDATYINRQLNFNLSATGKDVRLRYPAGVSSTADANLHWAGTRAASSVTGDITIGKMAITPGFDFGSYLDRSRQGSPLTAANSPLYNVKLDIHVRTSPELQMRTAIARLSGDADLRVRGSVARPAILGRVDILEGQATFHGTHYTLEHGDISFANPVSIEPQLNLQASTHVRNYDLSLTITGSPDHGLNLNYRSEPPLPKSDIIALLALGRTNAESQQLQEQSGQTAFTDQASDLILNQALDTTVSSRFQRLFGASNIKIDPQGLSTETNPTGRGPQVTIEQEFANNLSLTYSTNVTQSSQQIIQGEYYINRNVSLVGTRDQNGVVSFDVQVRRRKK